MTKMLDILETFLNFYGYKYLRLDGSTKVEDRQRLMERFNTDTKIFIFILSTRSGGVGINLTGADTVIFYDNDWNPAIDQQAQDRCHRIGQTRPVTIYRLVTEKTIEENILKKSNQKRQMNDMVIGDGQFNTDFFDKLDPRELLGLTPIEEKEIKQQKGKQKNLSQEEKMNLMASLEDESDRFALRRFNEENTMDQLDFDENFRDKKVSHFESMLTPVQRYALHFAEVIDPVISQQEILADEKKIRSRRKSLGTKTKRIYIRIGDNES